MAFKIKRIPKEQVFTYTIEGEEIVVGIVQASGETARKFEIMSKPDTTRVFSDENVEIKVDFPTDEEVRALAAWLTIEECSLTYDDGQKIFAKGMEWSTFRERWYNPAFIVELDGGIELDLRDIIIASVAQLNPTWFPRAERERLGTIYQRFQG